MSPSQLKIQLTTTRERLDEEAKLPSLITEVVEFYKIMQVHGQLVSDHLLFVVQLPLVIDEVFKFCKAIPVPEIVPGIL